VKWNSVKESSEAQFRRLSGVKRAVFDLMVEVLKAQRQQKRKRASGRKALLSTEDQILLLLGYYREYRSLLSLGTEFGLSESRTSTLIREIECLLLKDKRFHLKGKKALLIDDTSDDESAIIDVSESPVERPKKSKGVTIQARKSGIPLKLSWSSGLD
jgi:hypothetical protein